MTNYLNTGYMNKVQWYSQDGIFDAIFAGKSVIRIGDGEIGLLNGGQVSYQRYVQGLASELKECIKRYKPDSPYILALPLFVEYSNRELRHTKGGIACWLPLKIMYRLIFNKKAQYMDAHFFYEKKNLDVLVSTFLIKKKIIINTTLENIRKIEKNNRNLDIVASVVSQTPNPYDLYLDTKQKISAIITEYKGDKKDVIILCSSGPMGKVLAYYFTLRGIQCIDIGLGIEQFETNLHFEESI